MPGCWILKLQAWSSPLKKNKGKGLIAIVFSHTRCQRHQMSCVCGPIDCPAGHHGKELWNNPQRLMYTHFNLLDMSQYITIYWLQTTQQHVSSAELRRSKECFNWHGVAARRYLPHIPILETRATGSKILKEIRPKCLKDSNFNHNNQFTKLHWEKNSM